MILTQALIPLLKLEYGITLHEPIPLAMCNRLSMLMVTLSLLLRRLLSRNQPAEFS